MRQRDKILSVLADREWHANTEFLDMHIPRYAARILELKRFNYQIETKNGKGSLYSYRLVMTPQEWLARDLAGIERANKREVVAQQSLAI